jgi:hypothetical protein
MNMGACPVKTRGMPFCGTFFYELQRNKEIRVKRIAFFCCIAVMFASCDAGIDYEDVDNPVYKAELLPGKGIASAEDFIKIGADQEYPLNDEYYLKNDIDLSNLEGPWTPIGTQDQPFTGILNGNGKTIRGLRLQGGETEHIGLFGYLFLARISNLTVELANDFSETNPIVLSASVDQYLGVVAGYAKSSNITGVRVSAAEGKGLYTIKSEAQGPYSGGQGFIGGITGWIQDGGIQNSTAHLTLKAAGTKGSQFAGLISGVGSGSLSDCTAQGSVEVTIPNSEDSHGGTIYAGGIVGQAYSSVDNCTSEVTRVYAENANPQSTGSVYAGGVTGSGETSNSRLVTSSPVTIHAKGAGANDGRIYAGGIVGSNYSSNNYNWVTAQANIQAESSGNQEIYAGGIAGNGPVSHSYISNSAGVTVLAKATNSVASKIIAAGGISGSSSNISNCFSGANVKVESDAVANFSFNYPQAVTAAGGLVGYFSTNELKNSYATGTVEVVSTNTTDTNKLFAGGLVGIGVVPIAISKSVALNESVTIQYAAGTPYAYRVLGGAGVSSYPDTELVEVTSVSEDTRINLLNNHVSEDMQVKTKTESEEWKDFSQGENDPNGLMGNDSEGLDTIQTKSFFSGTLGWDFDKVWTWDSELKLPILNLN